VPSSPYFHQTLHGYRDGHELLAASCELPRTAQRQMLVLSDLSGDDVTKGFRAYVTGYALEGTQSFALARTWYAEEMPRPGCVWTHTLLLPFDVLADVQDVRTLLTLFERPSGSLSTYRVPIHPPSLSPIVPIDCNLESFAAEVVSELFSSQAPVLIAAETTLDHEPLILALWTQLPYELRSRLFFSTGSLDFRTWENRPFDLQVVPTDRWKRIARRAGVDVIPLIRSVNPQEAATKPAPPWATTLARELIAPNPRFRALLGRLAGGAHVDRTFFGVIVEMTLVLDRILRGEGTVEHLVALIGETFPGNEALSLKVSLLGPRTGADAEQLLPTVPEQDVLRALLTTKHPDAFPLETLDVPSRARRAFAPNGDWEPSGLQWLCTELSLSSSARALRDELLRTLSPDDLLTVFGESRSLLERVATLCPSLLEEPGVWNQHPEFQRACLSALKALPERRTTSVIFAVVHAPRFALARELVCELDGGATALVLTALNESLLRGNAVDEWRWPSALRDEEWDVRNWLRNLHGPLAGRMLAIVASLGNADHDALGSVSAGSVLAGVMHEKSQGASSYNDADVAALALAIAFSDQARAGAQLAAELFERVHDAIMRSSLSWTSWRQIERLVPRAGLFSIFDWDHAEKLRRGLVERFLVRPNWPPDLFAQALRNPDTRDRTVAYCLGLSDGQKLLQAVGAAR